MTDLYDRIRPADEILDDDTQGRVWARITGEARPSVQAESPHRPVGRAVEPEDDSDVAPRRRRIAGWAAAAAVAVGVVGIAAAAATRSDVIAPADAPEPTQSLPSPDSDPEPSPDPAPDVEVVEVVGTVPDPLSSGTRFAVADHVLDGWTIESMRAEAGGPLFGDAQWAQLGPDGEVTGVISVRPPILLTDEQLAEPDMAFDDTVRGLPADEWQDSENNGMAVQRTGIYWIEESQQMQVSATGTATDLVRPVAEALVLDAERRTVALPDSFDLVPADRLEFVDGDAVKTTVVAQPAWSDVQGMAITTQPNTFGFGLERLVGTSQDWLPVELDEAAALGKRTPEGSLLALSWLDGDMFVTLSTSLALSDDEVLDVVRGIRFTDADEFRTVGTAIAARADAEIAEWTVFDRLVLSDGIEISIRSKPDGTGANAMCIETVVTSCELIQSEGGLVDGFESYGAAGFDLVERRIGVGWVSSEIDEATIEPTLRSSDEIRPEEFVLAETTAAIVNDTTTDVGRFVVVDLPEGERPPAIRFESGDDSGPLIDLTPMVSGPFEF